MSRNPSTITPEIKRLAAICKKTSFIDEKYFTGYKVFRGLRDDMGRGVLTGLTEVSEVCGHIDIDGKTEYIPGELFYRGYDVQDIVADLYETKRYGFEETIYLLLFGHLPGKTELANFQTLLGGYRNLPTTFVRDVVMKAPSRDIMNSMARGVLTLYSYDEFPDDTSVPNVLRQCLSLIAVFPQLAVYSYQAYDYYKSNSNSFFFHDPEPTLSTAQNILHMLRLDSKYTETEAHALDIALVLHAEHGGGNNSTFTTRVVTSTGTDTYSVIAAGLASLKGPKHGGANIKVIEMMEDIKANVNDWKDRDEVNAYLRRIYSKEAFDRSGLIYGLGHAVYSTTDPRALIFEDSVKRLSEEKGTVPEYELYRIVADEALNVLTAGRKPGQKGVCVNVDFYSGFVYRMLGLPEELYTPIFAMSRIAGWSAHRIEEIVSAGKIIRPAYECVQRRRPFVSYGKRK